MIYASIGLILACIGIAFIIIGAKQHWREAIMGAITLTAVGIFILVFSLLVLL